MTGAKITFTIPPANESSFVWRRDFLHAIRAAIGQAQVNGQISEEIAIESFRALPPISDSSKSGHS